MSAGAAVDVARSALDKAGKGVSDAVSRLLPGKQAPDSAERDSFDLDNSNWSTGSSRKRSRGDLYAPEDSNPFGGLLGRTAGSMLGGMFGQLSELVAASSQEAADTKDRALEMIRNDQEVQSALGNGVRIMPGMDSQATSTSIINGKRTKQTTLSFLVAGNSGRTATAQADVTSGTDGAEDVKVVVQLQDGRRITVSGGGGKGGKPPKGGSGATIDVDWKEVR